MVKYEPATATAVIGLAGFQLLQAWNNNAPSLSSMREAAPGDLTCKQQLMDADIMVGGLAVILGVTFTVLAHDMTALLVMLAIFGVNSFWYHQVLAAESR